MSACVESLACCWQMCGPGGVQGTGSFLWSFFSCSSSGTQCGRLLLEGRLRWGVLGELLLLVSSRRGRNSLRSSRHVWRFGLLPTLFFFTCIAVRFHRVDLYMSETLSPFFLSVSGVSRVTIPRTGSSTIGVHPMIWKSRHRLMSVSFSSLSVSSFTSACVRLSV